MLQFPAKVWTGLSEEKVRIRTQGRSHKEGKTAQAGPFPTRHAGPTCSSCPDDLVLMLGLSAVSRDVWRRNALC